MHTTTSLCNLFKVKETEIHCICHIQVDFGARFPQTLLHRAWHRYLGATAVGNALPSIQRFATASVEGLHPCRGSSGTLPFPGRQYFSEYCTLPGPCTLPYPIHALIGQSPCTISGPCQAAPSYSCTLPGPSPLGSCTLPGYCSFQVPAHFRPLSS